MGKVNVVIKGDYPHTRINTVLNRLGCIRPGELADTREMHKAETRLKASQLFEVDPKNGSATKIAFSPPGLDKADEDELADAPGKPAGVRRQSPGMSPPGPTTANAANAAGSPDRTVNVRVEATWIGGDIPDEPPLWKQGQPPPAPASARQVPPPAAQPVADGQFRASLSLRERGGGEGNLQPMADGGRTVSEGSLTQPSPVGEGAARSPHPNPLPVGEGAARFPHPNPLPVGEGAARSPHPSPLPAGDGAARFPHANPVPDGEGAGRARRRRRIGTGGGDVPALFGPLRQCRGRGKFPAIMRRRDERPGNPVLHRPKPGKTPPATMAAVASEPPGMPAGPPNREPMVPAPPPRLRPQFVVRGYNPDGGVSVPTSNPDWATAPPPAGPPVPPGVVSGGPVNPPPVDGLAGPNISYAPHGRLPARQHAASAGRLRAGADRRSGAGRAGALFRSSDRRAVPARFARRGRDADRPLHGERGRELGCGPGRIGHRQRRKLAWTRWPTNWEDIRDGVAWRGNGERLQIQLMPGTEIQRYSVTWQNPNVMDSDVGLGLNAYYFQREYLDWWETWMGGRVSLGYQFAGAHRQPGGPLRPSRCLRPGHAGGAERQTAARAGLRGGASQLPQRHQPRADQRYPRQRLPRHAGTLPRRAGGRGGRHLPVSAPLDARQYFLITQRPDTSGRQVLSVNGHVGWTGDQTPIYDALFAGGFSSLRGFDFRGAGPHDNSVSVGGDFEVLAGVEYLFPITADDMLRGVLFVDTGTVEPSITDWSNHYRVAPGFGLRITIPAMGPAPIALDFAFPVALNHGDQVNNFSFFVGFLR